VNRTSIVTKATTKVPINASNRLPDLRGIADSQHGRITDVVNDRPGRPAVSQRATD